MAAKINLGSGTDYKQGWINVDYFSKKADIRHNLNVFPYPFKDGSAEFIVMNQILEHLDNPVRVIEECHRILGEGGTLQIEVPHFSNPGFWTDMTHRRPFTSFSMGMFASERNDSYQYSKAKFNVKVQVLAPLSILWSLNKFTLYLFDSLFCNFMPVMPGITKRDIRFIMKKVK